MTAGPQYATKSDTRLAKATANREPIIRLEKLDIHLLRELLQGSSTLPLNPHFGESYRSIARKIGVHEDTARNRVLRLRESGFIQDWGIMVNPNLLGLHQFLIDFDVPSNVSKTELITRLKLVPEVFLILNAYGSFLGVIFAYDTPYSLQNTIALVQSLANSQSIARSTIPWPESKLQLSTTDWRILRSLQRDPRKSRISISREVEVSIRTVERRLQRMVEAQVLFTMVSLDLRALDGTVLVSLTIAHSIQDRLLVSRRISEELDEYLWHVFFTIPENPGELAATWFSLALPSLAKAREILEWVEKQEGVRTPRIRLWEDHIVVMRNLDHFLEEKLTNLGLN